MNWETLYEAMICRDRWDFRPGYFRSENLIMLESIGMLWDLFDYIEEIGQ